MGKMKKERRMIYKKCKQKNQLKEKMYSSETMKGITLIALVITIALNAFAWS